MPVSEEFDARPVRAFLPGPGVQVDESAWPASVPAMAQLLREGLEVPAGLTVLVGENGSGKSTVVESLAEAYGLNPQGGSVQAKLFRIRDSEPGVGRELTVVRGLKPRWSYFLRADTMSQLYTYLEQNPGLRPERLHELSHGESFLEILRTRVNQEGFYLMDEPDAPLSFVASLGLAALLHDLAAAGSQVIVATHSPVVAAIPGAHLLELGPWGMRAASLGGPEPGHRVAAVHARPAVVLPASVRRVMTEAGHRIARVGVPGTGISEAAAEVLHRVFGYSSFRGQQQEIIEHLCGGGDAVALMPTGSGKSLCYQIPALVRDGTGVVISPLIALMQDQVDALRLLGVRADFLNSTQDPDSRRGRGVRVPGRQARPAVPGAGAAADRIGAAAARAGHGGAVRDRRGALRGPVGARLPARLPGTVRAARAMAFGAADRGDGHRDPADAGRDRHAARARRGPAFRGQLRPAQHPVPDRAEERAAAAVAAAAADRAPRGSGHRVLPVPGFGGEDGGVPVRRGVHGAAVPRRARRADPGRRTSRGSCARTG